MTIEAMKLALDALETPHPGVRTDLSDALDYREKVKQAITALRQAIEQAQPARADAQDAARYRWLRENNHEEASVMAYIHGLDDWAPWADAESVDAAIDAAMKEQE